MKIAILGTGAYGMAISSILIDNNHSVTMWTKFDTEKENLLKNRKNEKLLPGFILDKDIKITNILEEAIKDKDLIIIAIPTAYIDDLAKDMEPYIDNNHILIATKGIEQNTGLFVHEILAKHLKTANYAVISGPSFAKDIVKKMPVGLSLAGTSRETTSRAIKALANNYIKLRETNDLIGIETCGAIKNVIALSAGMLEGLGATDSTTAMFLTEATHDMMEILSAVSSSRSTVTSFAGLGDLLLTCTSVQSRNYRYGLLIGSNKSKDEINDYLKNTTVEGYYTLKSIYKLLHDKNVEVPIIDLIYDIIFEEKDPKELLTFLVEKA